MDIRKSQKNGQTIDKLKLIPGNDQNMDQNILVVDNLIKNPNTELEKIEYIKRCLEKGACNDCFYTLHLFLSENDMTLNDIVKKEFNDHLFIEPLNSL